MPPADLSAVRVQVEPAYPNDVIYGNRASQIAPDGTFHLADLAPDRYRVRASTGRTGLYLKTVRMGGRELPGHVLELNGAAEIEIVLSAKTAAVTGVVRLDSSGTPAPGATVVLIPQEEERREDENAYPRATADGYGKFKINNIAPGEYRAFAWENLPLCCDYIDPEFIRPQDSKAVPVTLNATSSAGLELTAIAARK
jgi:hypothetical protein